MDLVHQHLAGVLRAIRPINMRVNHETYCCYTNRSIVREYSAYGWSVCDNQSAGLPATSSAYDLGNMQLLSTGKD